MDTVLWLAFGVSLTMAVGYLDLRVTDWIEREDEH